MQAGWYDRRIVAKEAVATAQVTRQIPKVAVLDGVSFPIYDEQP